MGMLWYTMEHLNLGAEVVTSSFPGATEVGYFLQGPTWHRASYLRDHISSIVSVHRVRSDTADMP